MESDRSARQNAAFLPREVTPMSMKLVPLHDRVLVRRVEEEETTRGGIVIPDTAKDKPQEGEVIAAGKGKVNEKGRRFPLDVKEGDRVLFGKYAGSEIKINGEELLIIREDEVLAILTGTTKAKEHKAETRK